MAQPYFDVNESFKASLRRFRRETGVSSHTRLPYLASLLAGFGAGFVLLALGKKF